MLGAVVHLLAEIVGETVRQSVDAAVTRLEQTHTRERDALAERFEAALERQDTRLREVLEHQARQHADDLRVILRDALTQRPAGPNPTPTTETGLLDELQETLRLGFGEIRGALDRHHKELMHVARSELQPLAQTVRHHLNRPEPPKPIEPDETRPPAAPPSRASPSRAPPVREEDSSSRLYAAIDDGDPEDSDDLDDHADPHRRELHYRPPSDDDPPRSHLQEASP